MQAKKNTPLITDQLLTELAAPDSQASLGEWDGTTRAMLATAIPEMAVELLKRREVDKFKKRDREIANRDQSLSRARSILKSPNPIEPRKLIIACQTLAQQSPCPEERDAAKQTLKEMEAA